MRFILFLHLAAAILWMGGMAFMILALRPPLQAQLAPPVRLPLMVAVLSRFFAVVAVSVAVLLATGVWMMAAAGRGAPPGWHAMAGLGLLMALVFGHLYAVPFRKLRRAVAAGDWPAGGKWMGQVALLAQLNFALGWLAIAAVVLWR